MAWHALLVLTALCCIACAAPEKHNVPPPPAAFVRHRRGDWALDLRKRDVTSGNAQRGDGAARLRRELRLNKQPADARLSADRSSAAGAAFGRLKSANAADAATMAQSRANVLSTLDDGDAFRVVKSTCLSVWVRVALERARVRPRNFVLMLTHVAAEGLRSLRTFSTSKVFGTELDRVGQGAPRIVDA